MALINRMSRLFTADVHAVLDRIEEPDVLLRHAVREMEEALERADDEVRMLEQECTTLADRQRKVESQLEELGEQLDISFGAGNEELARRLVKRKLETERLGKHIVERRVTTDKALAERRKKLDEQREHLDVMRQKAELLTERRQGETSDADWSKAEFVVTEDEVEVAYLRERQRRTRS